MFTLLSNVHFDIYDLITAKYCITIDGHIIPKQHFVSAYIHIDVSDASIPLIYLTANNVIAQYTSAV